LKRIAFLLSELAASYKPLGWRMGQDDSLLRRALLLAGANARAVRRMLALSLILYGPKAAEKEFLLRRITHLSLYTFALLALAGKLGRRRQPAKSDRDALACLIEEAIEVRQKCRHISDSPFEAAESRLLKQMEKERAPEGGQ